MGKLTATLTAKDRILKTLARASLSTRPWTPATVLCHPAVGGIDFRRRIHELRKGGREILSRRVPGRAWNEYLLVIE